MFIIETKRVGLGFGYDGKILLHLFLKINSHRQQQKFGTSQVFLTHNYRD